MKKLRNLISNNIIQNSTCYLGYSVEFRNTKMFFSLMGEKSFIDIHSIQHTKFQLSTLLNILSGIFRNFGNTWIVKPGSAVLRAKVLYKLSNFEQKTLNNYLVIWSEKWLPGFFTNTESFMTTRALYKQPSTLLYTSHTDNKQRLADGANTNLLQAGFADSNSNRTAFSYPIAANEKTEATSEFFFKLCVSLASSHAVIKRSNFFKCFIK